VDHASASASYGGTVQWTRSNNLLLISLRGPIDLRTADLLADATAAAAPPTPRIVVDLSAVTFFGSAGLAFLAGLAGRTEGPVVISALPTFVRSVLLSTGMTALVALPTE
jgi:anti-anti-sigma factor